MSTVIDAASECMVVHGSKFRVRVSTHARDNFDQRLDILMVGVEVHDAGAQHVTSADDRVGHERLAATLQAIEQRLVQRIEMRINSGIPDLRSQVARDVSKRRDAQVLSHELEFI